MKKYLIVLFLVIAQIGAFYLKANAQAPRHFARISASQMDSGEVVTKEIIADETTLSYTSKYAKIECDNDKVFMKLFTTHYQIISRFTASWKVNSIGNAYKHYTIFMNKQDAELIKSWSKNNL
jgi:hypothetical protein